ncbi:MAG: hypothetical protein M9894_27760 [Planctomycetes bacterium]|nr:hypothetical protein [Planctomycetota bacterium]
MSLLDSPLPSRPLAVQVHQSLSLKASAPTNWWKRNQTTSEAWVQLNTGGTTATLVWEAPATIANRLTFDRIQIFADASEPGSGETEGLHLNVCEGPVAVLWATAQAHNAALEEPPLRPWDDESDDPPLGLPLVMPAANRDGMATYPLESAAGAGGPANLIAHYGPGLFVDTAGRLGCRTSFTNDVRGLGPFPPVIGHPRPARAGRASPGRMT